MLIRHRVMRGAMQATGSFRCLLSLWAWVARVDPICWTPAACSAGTGRSHRKAVFMTHQAQPARIPPPGAATDHRTYHRDHAAVPGCRPRARNLFAQAVLADAADVLAIDQHASGLHIVQALDQGDQGGLAGTGGPDDADLLAGRDVQVQSVQRRRPLRIGKAHLFEPHIALGQGQRRVRIDDGMRLQDDLQRVGDGAQLLGGVHQRQRQVARAVQDAEGQRADQHHVARAHRAGAPHADRPHQHAAGHHRQADVVDHAGLFHVHPAAAMGHRLVADLLGQPRAFAVARRKRLDRPHSGHCIHQLAAHAHGLPPR